MLTRRQPTRYQFFHPSKSVTPCRDGYESFPMLAEIKGSELIIDGYEQPSDRELKELSDVATEIMKLYALLDDKHHDFTLVTFTLEKLFTMLHQAAYGNYLDKRNFVAEVGRLARAEEVGYVPAKTLPKGAMFEMKSMADVPTASSSTPVTPASSSSERFSYGR